MGSINRVPTRVVKQPWERWYDRQMWRGPHGLRYVVLARDPVCMICQRVASTIADHIIPHKGNWTLFCDLNNLQGICDDCHAAKTAREDGGFGNRRSTPSEVGAPAATGADGKQFQSSSVSSKKLDSALSFDEVDLLKGIPE